MKMRSILLSILCVLFVVAVEAQKLQLLGTSPNLFLTHTVQPKENWYSVGRIYNISPKEMAPFNNTVIEKPLSIGQQLKVPLNTTNFSQDGIKAEDESLVPLYHTVADKEWMYRVSTNYKVPVENLEKWNNISKDQVKAGMTLVVGYLKVKTSLSSLASGAATTIPTVVKPPVTNEVKKEEKKAEPIITKSEPVKPAPVAEKKPEPVKTAPSPVKKETPVLETKPVTVSNPTSIDFKEGYFKNEFDNAGKSLQGAANIFRSTSGFTDGKYYALMNNIPVGTIVKVGANSKIIYAKVLGNLTDIKENAGLLIRISNAAATELGVGENKFTAEVKY